jgi:hypothetical protein
MGRLVQPPPLDVRDWSDVDVAELLAERQKTDGRFKQVIHFLERGQQLDEQLGLNAPRMADGNFYVDTRPPFMIANETAIAGTSEALLWRALFSQTTANYWTVGKMWWIQAAGKITTAASSPGNLTLTARYGTTTGGTSLAASAATALGTSKTNITWGLTIAVCCQAIGATGSLLCWGNFSYDGAGAVFSTASNNPLYFPASAPAATSVDTTAAQGIVLGVTLGSASDGMTCQWLSVEALN